MITLDRAGAHAAKRLAKSSRAGRPIGLVLDIGGDWRNVVTLAPSLAITTEEMNLADDLLDLSPAERPQN